MPDNNSSQLNESLNNLNSLLGNFNTSLKSSDTLLSNLEKVQDQLTREQKRRKERANELKQSMTDLAPGMLNFAGELKSNEGSFKLLNTVINVTTKVTGGLASMLPFVGDALKSVAEGAGEVAKLIVDSFEKAYGSYEKLSGSGLLSTFTDLSKIAAETSLSFTDLEKTLTSNSQRLAVFSGTALKGREEFQKISGNTKETREKFRRLGINALEFSNLQMGYMELQMRYAVGNKLDRSKIQSDSIKYIQNLDVMSKMTGMSREEIQKKLFDMTLDARYAATMASLSGKKAQEEVEFFMTLTGSIDEELRTGLKDMLAARGNPNTDAGKATAYALSEMGIDPMKFSRQLLNGEMTGDQAATLIAKNSNKYLTSNKFLAAQAGKNTVVTRQYAGFTAMAARANNDFTKIRREAHETQLDTLEDDKSKNSDLAKTSNSFYNTANMIQQMSISSELVTKAMNYTSRGIEDFTETIYKSLGVELPPFLQFRRKERDLTDNIVKLQNELVELETYRNDELKRGLAGHGSSAKIKNKKQEIEKKERELHDLRLKNIKNKEKDAVTSTGTTSAPGVQLSGTGMSNDYSGLNINNGRKVNGVYESVAGGPASAKIISLARKFQSQYPGGTFTAFNDTRKGNSEHTKGLAFDYTLPENLKQPSNNRSGSFRGPSPQAAGAMINFLKQSGASFALDEYNHPSRGATGGHIHAAVSARTGGILSGPDSGYLTELHGDEAVVPVDSGDVSKSALNTSLFQDSQESSLDSVFKMMTSRINSMISILDGGINKQRKIVQGAG